MATLITPILEAMRAKGHDPEFHLDTRTVDCCRSKFEGADLLRCSLSINAEVIDLAFEGWEVMVSECRLEPRGTVRSGLVQVSEPGLRITLADETR